MARIINADGVTINVKMVAKPKPNTIDTDNCTHNPLAGAPKTSVRLMKSMPMLKAIGNNPNMVVTVVSSTGRKRCAPVNMIASRVLAVVCLMRSKVSINTMLLLTTMPANAITPMPPMTMPNGWPVTNRPTNTPSVDITTALKIKKPE